MVITSAINISITPLSPPRHHQQQGGMWRKEQRKPPKEQVYVKDTCIPIKGLVPDKHKGRDDLSWNTARVTEPREGLPPLSPSLPPPHIYISLFSWLWSLWGLLSSLSGFCLTLSSSNPSVEHASRPKWPDVSSKIPDGYLEHSCH